MKLNRVLGQIAPPFLLQTESIHTYFETFSLTNAIVFLLRYPRQLSNEME